MTKQLSSFCFLLLITSAFIAGCEQDLNSTDTPEIRPMAAKGKPTHDAHPALTYTSKVSYRGSYYATLNVMDTDATDQTELYRVPSASMLLLPSPTWSPNGGSIVFTQYGSGSVPDTIKAIDVSVNSDGEAVGSNLRTILGLSTSLVRIKNPFWCSATATGKIAYTTSNGTTESLWVISESGGTPTEIFRVDTAWAHYPHPLGCPTWNPDDSRLAMIRIGAGGASTTIMIFNTSTGSYDDSITVSGAIWGLEWSRSGMNKLAFGLAASGNTKLYYCDPTTGATPTTNNVIGCYPTWAPNNSSVIYTGPNSSYDLYKNIPFTSTTSTINTNYFQCVKWK